MCAERNTLAQTGEDNKKWKGPENQTLIDNNV